MGLGGDSTCIIPMRKVTEAATTTLCSSLVRPSKPVMLAGGPSSGTSRVTTEPIIKHRTGNAPSEGQRDKERKEREGVGERGGKGHRGRLCERGW